MAQKGEKQGQGIWQLSMSCTLSRGSLPARGAATALERLAEGTATPVLVGPRDASRCSEQKGWHS